MAIFFLLFSLQGNHQHQPVRKAGIVIKRCSSALPSIRQNHITSLLLSCCTATNKFSYLQGKELKKLWKFLQFWWCALAANTGSYLHAFQGWRAKEHCRQILGAWIHRGAKESAVLWLSGDVAGKQSFTVASSCSDQQPVVPSHTATVRAAITINKHNGSCVHFSSFL